MSVSPDVMDGVPEEAGVYFVFGSPLGSAKRFDSWHIVRVKKNTIFNGTEIVWAKEATSGEFMFNESVFDDFTWSERIKPPEEEDFKDHEWSEEVLAPEVE